VAEVGPLLGHIGGIPVEELAAALSGLSVGAVTAVLLARAGRLRSRLVAGRRAVAAHRRRA
jgi:hypothetical protein